MLKPGGLERTRTDAYIDGTMHNDKRLVKISGFNHPLSPLDLEELKRALEARLGEERPIALAAVSERRDDLVKGAL